ncbi:MAG: cyclase family protein [Haloferacaceae archaeon]
MIETDPGWTDLSLTIRPDMAKMPFLPCPEIDRLSEQSETSLQVSEVSFATHVGTHVDAACHAVADGKSVEEYGPDRWLGRAVVHEVDAEPSGAIEVADVEPVADELADADALVLRTGWEELIDEEAYYDHPFFSTELAEWLTERDLSWVGMDFLTPDRPPELRPEGFTYPVHTTLLDDDTLIVENLTNLADLESDVVDVAALPTKLADCDGAPIRVVAREVAE